ncbi:MAG: DUF2817 domain-containing protein [Spirochaetales bacterium]|nr:DUF2817 domain-containing protein [Spirochaetales bacterium]
MRNKHIVPTLIVLIILVFSLSCSGGIGDAKDFGNPPSPGSCFCDPDGVETYLEWVWGEYPQFTNLRNIGSSEDGRPIYVIELSDSPSYSEEEPAVLINGAIHGDEQLSAGICLKLIEHLLTAYDYYLNPDPDQTIFSEAEVEQAGYLIENFKIHILPAINPDGLASGERLNSNYVDLNRNFGYNWDESEFNNGEAAFDQAESAAVRDDFTEEGYSLAINLHTAAYTSNIGIYAPWDAIDSTTSDFIETYLPNYQIIKTIGSSYADTVSNNNPYPFNNYFHYEEGGDWYLMNGSMADWAMGTSGAVSYTIELYGAQNFTTDDSYLLDETWSSHKAAMLELIKKAELGSGGIIIDSNLSPVEDAVISLDYTGAASRAFIAKEYNKLAGNSAKDGSFRFLTGEGLYHITISKNGYQSVEMDVEVNSTGLTRTKDSLSYEFFPDYTLPKL